MSSKNEHAGHHHTHDHSHGMAKRTLRIAFFLTMLILAAELIGGFFANSLALLSDAGHVVTDIFALGLAWFATVQAERPANARKTFGYHRVGILAAFVNAVTLIVIAVVILWEAIQRFQHPEPIQPLVMFLSAGIAIAVNLYIGFGLRKESENLNARAAALHVFGDVGVSAGVILAGIIILLTDWTIADPILSVGIAVLIAIGAWRILHETIDILMEAVPKDISMLNLVDDMINVDGVQDVHDLHVWSITNNMNALSCHALIQNLPPSDSASILQSLNSMLSEKYRITHTTIQFECNARSGKCCEMDGLYCRMETAKEQCNGHSHDADSTMLHPAPRQVSAERNETS
ncbi:MAG TPA: cation diffusion facilitator family transporter [Ktedonobacteraceae bacterium]|nr:cation diffusion facilitator family transporter [Ktedonobacteraceae bacterium]